MSDAEIELIEYLAKVIPAGRVECAECGAEGAAAKAVIRGDQWFCSERCAERSLAPLIKPQPKGVKLNGWDI